MRIPYKPCYIPYEYADPQKDARSSKVRQVRFLFTFVESGLFMLS